MVYEHLHRYLWAAELVKGRRVLDLASGEGFGAAILAQSAEHVAGIDVDKRTVDHSSLNYAADNLEFHRGDAADLSRFDDDSFGAVVAFEMIEHVSDQERVLDEIGRVLGPDGLLIISTPDRRAYTDATDQVNPFHVHELEHEEFVNLLASRFGHTATWGQRTITGSALSALHETGAEQPAARTYFVSSEGDTWGRAQQLSPLYLVAVASKAELPAIPLDSTLADCGLELLRATEAADRRASEDRRGAVEADLDAALTRVSELEEALERRDRELRRTIGDRELEIERDRQRIDALAADAAEDRETIATLRAQGSTVSWELFDPMRRRAIALLGGDRSIATRAVRRALRPMTAAARRSRAAAAAPIELPEFAGPQVSIVIPVHSGAGLTRHCLESIRDNTSLVSYEVILVDDTADDETTALLAAVRGARILRNETNLNFLRSMNRGAAEARGRWLVLCNNDIHVLTGWLEAMVGCAESAPDVAIVTPKYLYPDLSLNEAGGVVWRDGSAGNYGRGEDPSECRFEFRREVDYGSAAALMVGTDFWRSVGGFDERYAPIYYEDTDLCFQAREHGLRVLFEPRANVVHVEGGTSGTDITKGLKRYQEINRSKFVDKWRHRLERDQLPPSEHNVRRAANRNRGPHVLILDHRVPMPDRDSGSLRMRAMIHALTDLGCRITFLPEDRHLVHPYTLDLLAAGVEVFYEDVKVEAELAEMGPELALVLTCRPHATSKYLDLVRECAPSAPVVYDTVDLHWLREARRAGLRDGSDQVVLSPKAVALREIELALIRATDVVLVVSPEERAQIEADVPGTDVRVVPNVNELRERVPPAEGRSGVIFIGGFEHTPNIDAAQRLVKEVMPRVWERHDDVRVTLIGGNVPPEIEALAAPLVDVAGWVKDIEPLFERARAMVAPLNWGAGLKGKVTQALAQGLPVVTTPIGAEGLDAVDGEQLLIGTDDDQLAAQVIRLLTDDDLWTRLSCAGQELAAARCSPTIMSAVFADLLGHRVALMPGASRP